ncbi:MAG: endonuclease/exonuclease/phosphatase family protein [Chloroflexota bacterium]
MRILTYNIHGWRTIAGSPNLDEVTTVLQSADADIVGLNEVYYPRVVSETPSSGASSPENKPALAVLAERLNMHYVFGPCHRWLATSELPADGYGNALLSRWPIIASASHHLTSIAQIAQLRPAQVQTADMTGDTDISGLGPRRFDEQGKEQRGLLESRILLPNRQTMTVYVTHLDHTDEETRLRQLRSARAWTVRDRNRAHIVLGDFNAISLRDYAVQWGQQRVDDLERLSAHPKGAQLCGGSKGPRVVAQMEKSGYIDALAQFTTSPPQTFIPAKDQPIRVDYIFVSKPLAPHLKMCQVWTEPVGEEASDHRPVMLDIDLSEI